MPKLPFSKQKRKRQGSTSKLPARALRKRKGGLGTKRKRK